MLTNVYKTNACSLYKINNSGKVREFIASTPQSQHICNDPSLCGVGYTDALRKACAAVLTGLKTKDLFPMTESETIVFHVLRGGLNYGLREALYDAYGWNKHSSAFISAQRARTSHNPEEWHITESHYRKVYLPEVATVVFGDVVATGTSLGHALNELLKAAQEASAGLRSILFFTFGGSRACEILEQIDERCHELFPCYEGATLIYLEGKFSVPEPKTPLSIKITGTDLVRRHALMAPEFIESSYQKPTYPLERCAIYDAGSRAFWLPEYLADLEHYWRSTLALASSGMTFTKLLKERMPEIDPKRFGDVDLATICRQQIDVFSKMQRM